MCPWHVSRRILVGGAPLAKRAKEPTMVRHGDLLLRPIPEPKKVLAAAEVAAFTLATSEATHTLTGRIEPATVEGLEGTAIAVVHVLEPSSLIHEEHPTRTVEPGWYEIVHQPPESEPSRLSVRGEAAQRGSYRHHTGGSAKVLAVPVVNSK